MSNRSSWRLAAMGLAMVCVACSRQVSPAVDARAFSSEDAAWWALSMTLETGSANGPEHVGDSGTLWWLTSPRAQALIKGKTSVVVYPPPCRDSAEFVVTQNGSSKKHQVNASGVELILGDGTSSEKKLARVTFDVVSASCNLSDSPDTRTFFLGLVQRGGG